MRIIYLAHPLSGDVPNNLARVRRWLRWVYDNFQVAVIADWILTCEVLDDANPAHREQGFAMDFALITAANEYWMVGGRVSRGMAEEEQSTQKRDITVRDLTWLGDEPPEGIPDELVRRWSDITDLLREPALQRVKTVRQERAIWDFRTHLKHCEQCPDASATVTLLSSSSGAELARCLGEVVSNLCTPGRYYLQRLIDLECACAKRK